MSHKIATPLSLNRSGVLGRVLSIFVRVSSLLAGVALCIAGASIMFMPDFAVGLFEQVLKILMGLVVFFAGFIVALSSSTRKLENVNFDPTFGEFYQVHDRSAK